MGIVRVQMQCFKNQTERFNCDSTLSTYSSIAFLFSRFEQLKYDPETMSGLVFKTLNVSVGCREKWFLVSEQHNGY